MSPGGMFHSESQQYHYDVTLAVYGGFIGTLGHRERKGKHTSLKKPTPIIIIIPIFP